VLRRTLLVASLLVLGVATADDGDKEPFAFSLEVKEKVLDNGLRVLVAPRKGAPRVACAVWFRVGSVDEEPGKTGLAHCLEHMFFKGSHRVGVKDAALGDKLGAQLDAAWDRKHALLGALGEARLPVLRNRERSVAAACGRLLGAGEDLAAVVSETAFLAASGFRAEDLPYFELRVVEQDFQRLLAEERKNDNQEELWDTYVQAGGTNLNAFTTEDTTQYIVTLPSNKLELFFWLESDRLADPVFREWYAERNVVKEERRNDENAADGPFYEGLNAVVFGPHPYGHPILGWMKDLDELTPRDARKFFQDHYTTETATIVLAGDVDPERAFALAARYFGRIARRKAAVTRPPVEPTCPGEKRFQLETDAEPRVEIYWRAPEPSSRDRDVLDVIAAVLAGETGRLYKRLVDEKEVATSVDAGVDNHRFAGRFHVAARAKPDTDLAALEQLLLAEVAALTTQLVTGEELARAKSRIGIEVVRGLEDLEATAEKLGQGAAVQGDWHAFIERSRRIRSVTAEEVQRVARATFKIAGRTTGVHPRGAGAREAEPEPTPDPTDPTPLPGGHGHPKPGHRR
jgi:predicted Zn-dependent peptidase